MNAAKRYRKINDFFNSDYKWWETVYDRRLPQGFFSFEMIRRKEILLERVKEKASAKASIAILECGCGPGGILGEINPSGQLLVGVDINFNALAKAKQRCDSIGTLLQADIERLPFHSNSFDIAYCVGVLSYLEDDRRALEEISRVMKPGGTIFVSVPNFFTLNRFLDPYYYLAWPLLWLGKRALKFLSRDPGSEEKYKIAMIRRYRYGQLDRLYREFGLQKKETFSVSFAPPTLWKKEIVPLCRAIRMSEALVELSGSRKFGMLKRLANHWVTCLEKSGGEIAEGA